MMVRSHSKLLLKFCPNRLPNSGHTVTVRSTVSFLQACVARFFYGRLESEGQ